MDLLKYSGNLSDADYLSLLVVDSTGGIRSVVLPISYVSEKIIKEGIGFDASNFGYAQVNKSDMVAIPDMTTAFIQKKDGFTTIHALADVWTTDGAPFDQYPRAIARKTLDILKDTGLADDVKMLLELEFYAFDDVHYDSAFDHSYYYIESAEGLGEDFSDLPRFAVSKGYHRLAPDDRYLELRNQIVDQMCAIGIPVKYHHHEVAASQLEIELNFMSILNAADSVALSKWIIKSVADELGLYVTFMPKPLYKVAGSGMHVHQFMEKNGKSIFPGEALYNLSETALNYTAGLLSHALTGSLLAWSNPSTNSFRRLVKGYEAPVSATFAQGSRAAAIRIPGYLKKGETRIEFRTGDATANTWYFLSAMVLAGIDGITRKLDPVKLGYASVKETSKNTFPTNLNNVLKGLSRDYDYLLKAFPKELIDNWIVQRSKDAEYVYNAPTPQEYELYF